MAFSLVVFIFVKSSSVLGGLLVPKDTSYGYVPRDTNLVHVSKNNDLWAPREPSDGYNSYGDAVVINAPDGSSNEVTKSGDGVVQNNVSHTGRHPKFSFPNTLYYYEPPPVPPPQYLPPPADPYPDYATSKPTDEEFINRPQNDYPLDVANPGYNYDTPDVPLDGLLPPFEKDEPYPDSPTNQYLPPANPFPPNGLYDAPYYGAKGSNLNSFDDADDGSVRPRNNQQIEVTDMRCFDTPSDGRFQSTITVRTPNGNMPVFEDVLSSDASACVVKSEVVQPRLNARFRINIPKSKFKECAVKDCSVSKDLVHLCVKLRFPTIPKMKLAEDSVLTLQCRTQDRIAAHTKHLSVNVDNMISARSSEVARGGTRGGLKTHMNLFRRGARGDHSESLPRGARVPLGEMLMLKAQIEPQDGWLASRMSTVTLSGSNGATLPLLGADGCRQTRAKALCPREAKSIDPLGHSLFIRAAMFEGMKSGEEIRLSVRMVACLDPADCKTPRCQNGGLVRSKRNAKESQEDTGRTGVEGVNHTIDTTSVLSFKVVLPDDFQDSNDVNLQPRNQTPLIVMLVVLCATLILSSALIFIKKQWW